MGRLVPWSRHFDGDSKASRLREHGVEGRNVVDAFAARTALYDDDPFEDEDEE